MQYFIGIVPNEEFKLKVTGFRDQWENNSISEVVEPHITLKSQSGLTPDKDWLEKTKQVCYETNPFQIKLGKPMFFGEDILYLSAYSDQLHELHTSIVNSVAPTREQIESNFELESFVPHMTLGKASYGLTKQELRDMASRAEIEIKPYPTFH